MEISVPKISEKEDGIFYSVNVISAKGRTALWYQVDTRYAHLISDYSDAALIALLIPAMALGENIYLSGKISEKIYFNVSRSLQKVLKSVIPSLNIVKIYPAEITSNFSRALGVATGFSAGIDSFCALADHYYGEVSPGFRVSHLLFNNVGSHGKGSEILFKKRYKSLEPIADRMGLPFVRVNSNLNTFYKGLSFQQTHTLRNASVALLLQNGIGRYLYASGYSYDNVFVGPSSAMGNSDPITLPLLSTEALDMFSVGGEYTRVEKTLRVAEIEDSYRNLDVCASSEIEKNRKNCSKCSKCLRTLLTLEIAGQIDKYTEVFDVGLYKRIRTNYIFRVLISNDIFLKEIVSFSKDKDFKFPLLSIVSSNLPFYKDLRDAIRNVYNNFKSGNHKVSSVNK